MAFKPDIDDLRESPALNIAKLLTSIENALKFVDIVVLLVDHIEFKAIDLSLLSGKQVVDTRGIWS